MLLLGIDFPWAFAAKPYEPADLNPVTRKTPATHPPIVLSDGGRTTASIAVMVKPSPMLRAMVANLQNFIEQASGAKLPITQGKIMPPAIVVGDCDLAREQGLVCSRMPVEGFAIKTIANHVLIAGRDETIAPGTVSDGTAWGVTEFLERCVGVRWYYPEELGQSIPHMDRLAISPVWLEDAPVFRQRVIWPATGNPWYGKGTPLGPLQAFLRSDNSWPVRLVVHSSNWAKVEEYRSNRPGVFQLRSDGTRDFSMLCYSNPKTLATYLEIVERAVAGEKRVPLGITGKSITVSPTDAEIACFCPDCRKQWTRGAGAYGSASRIVAGFTARLAEEVKRRWPEDRTPAPYLFPHTIQSFYRANRDKTVGSFIHGERDHWPRQHVSLYCWMKLLWNPEFNVDAAIAEYCRRMYGPAAATMRELIGLQIDGWERSRWPAARLRPGLLRGEGSAPRGPCRLEFGGLRAI